MRVFKAFSHCGAALGATALALTACSSHAAGGDAPAATATPKLHPISGLPVIDLTVTHGTAVHHFQVEVARTGPEQEKGLMFRTSMGADEGMIFPREQAYQASFWMKNTVIPLDIVFIDAQNRILNIAAKAIPYDETPLYSHGFAKAVLELNGGRAEQLGLAAGDVVKW